MIRWILARDKRGEDLDGYLTSEERSEGERYRHPDRHRQWLFGRAAAKNLVTDQAQGLGLPILGPRGLWIHRTSKGWPQVRDGEGTPLPVSLSIAHTSTQALCAMCPEEEGSLGADMEVVAERPEAFLEDFYTDGERERLAMLPKASRDRLATLLWTIKEAVLKARRTGLTESAKKVDVVSVEVLPTKGWRNADVIVADGLAPKVFWRWLEEDQLFLAIAKLPSEPTA